MTRVGCRASLPVDQWILASPDSSVPYASLIAEAHDNDYSV